MDLTTIDATRWPHWRSDDGNVLLINADCLEVLPTLPKEIAIVSDPPYGIKYRHGSRRGGVRMGTDCEAVVGDDRDFNPGHLFRFDHQVIWGAEHFKNSLPRGGRWLSWDKRPNGKVNDQGDAEHAWCNQSGVARMIRFLWDGFAVDERDKSRRVHPTQKPVPVMEWCLGFVPEANAVTDPYAGSGTTGVACVRLGRQFIGIELEPRYYEIAIKRIKAEIERFPLFEQVEAKERTLFDEVAE